MSCSNYHSSLIICYNVSELVQQIIFLFTHLYHQLKNQLQLDRYSYSLQVFGSVQSNCYLFILDKQQQRFVIYVKIFIPYQTYQNYKFSSQIEDDFHKMNSNQSYTLRANLVPIYFINFIQQMSATEICNAMVQFAHQIKQMKHYPLLTIQSFADGLPFSIILASTQQYDLSCDDLDQKCTKWISKVSNLKKIQAKIRLFFQKKILKTDKIDEIDVVQIAKHTSEEHLAKYFEVVMTVLLNSTRKDYYIQTIMNLDVSAQKTFVKIIKNSSQEEQSMFQQNSVIVQLQQELKELRRENADLRSSVSQLTRKNKLTQKQLKDLRDKLISYEEEMQFKKNNDHNLASDDLLSQNDKQRIMIDNLKIKLLTTVRESQMEISQLKEEISALKLKCQNYEDMQSTLQQYKDLYNQHISQLQKMNELEIQKRKLVKTIEDKDNLIRQLQNKPQLPKEKNNPRFEDDSREGKFKPLEKEIKRLKSEPAELTIKGGDADLIEEQKDQIKYLQEQLNRAKMRVKQFEKQNIKNRKKLGKLNELQQQRKRLQRVIVQINKCKDSQIELLLVSLNELRQQNIKMFEIIRSNHFKK